MRRLPALWLLLLLFVHPATASNGEDEARKAAKRLGLALTSADATLLSPLLPSQGKIQLRLDRLGPEEGFFSAGQVEALLGDFLTQGSVRDFEVLRLECDESIAIVHAQAAVTDRQGQRALVKLHLAWQARGERWLLREIRELSP